MEAEGAMGAHGAEMKTQRVSLQILSAVQSHRTSQPGPQLTSSACSAGLASRELPLGANGTRWFSITYHLVSDTVLFSY